ncbi:hypothetical protein EV714DRAFT_251236 [Schizophyllum commune]
MDHTPRTAIILASILFLLVRPAVAHVAAWHKSMWCLNGTTPGVDNPNNREPGTPLYNLKFEDWWFHHINKCDEFPPAEGDFLDLPANGHFTIEHATDRAFTSLSYDGNMTGVYIDGKDHLEGLDGGGECITNPNKSMAAGTAFAISYQSDLSKVTLDNLVVFTVLYNTPWRRLATYEVPNLPACPEGGCICAIAEGCGQPNMYMLGFRCRVTGEPGHLPLAKPRSAVYCGDEKSATPAALRKNPKCVKGAKKFLSWQQKEGNTVHEKQWADERGQLKFPGYNARMGFADGAQHDIFDTRPTFASLGGFFGIWRIMAAGHLAAGAVF